MFPSELCSPLYDFSSSTMYYGSDDDDDDDDGKVIIANWYAIDEVFVKLFRINLFRHEFVN